MDILNLFVCVDDEERGGRVYQSSALCNTKAFREAFVNYVAFEAENTDELHILSDTSAPID